jgi:hypothetical protein
MLKINWEFNLLTVVVFIIIFIIIETPQLTWIVKIGLSALFFILLLFFSLLLSLLDIGKFERK